MQLARRVAFARARALGSSGGGAREQDGDGHAFGSVARDAPYAPVVHLSSGSLALSLPDNRARASNFFFPLFRSLGH